MIFERNSEPGFKVQPTEKSGKIDFLGHIKHLPYDILLDIFSRVSVESVLECILVCKHWGNLLTHKRRYFNDTHVRRQLSQLHDDEDGAAKVDSGLLFARTVNGNDKDVALYYGGQYNDKINTDEQYTYKTTLKKIRHAPQMCFQLPRAYLVGSCNGLICLGRYHGGINDPIYIFNPVTGDCTYLPKFNIPPERVPSIINRLARGFGYVRSTDEYKVVRIFFRGFRGEGQVQVYTLGSGCGWRNKKNVRFPFGVYEKPGIFANEAIYWVERLFIYAFDLASEEFQLVPSPSCLTNCTIHGVDSNYGLLVLAGNLCFFYQDRIAPQMEIWSLKSDKTWIKDFSIARPTWIKDFIIHFWPILLTKNGEVILARLNRELYCYNPRTASWRLLVDDEGVDEIDTIPHVNTLVSLKAIGEKPSRRRN